jgi:hypothetical protein
MNIELDHSRPGRAACLNVGVDPESTIGKVICGQALRNDELVALLRQIHEAANKVYQMGDATARNTLVNIYEISGKILTIATAK